MKKVLFVVIVVAIAGAFGWQVYRKASSSGSARTRRGAASVAVEVEPVRKTTIRDVAQFTGSLLPRSYFVVAPKIAGQLEELLVNIGDWVQPNQLLARLDDDEYDQQFKQAQAELEVMQASVSECLSTLEVAKREYERAQTLRQTKVASESELDEAEARYKSCEAKHQVALAQVKQKQASLEAAQVRLSYAEIKASWEEDDGPRVVGERFVDEGAMLRANDPIVSILDIESLTAVIHVGENDYPKLRAGQAVIVSTDAFPERSFSGEVLRVAPLLKETSRQARVEVEVPNPDHLLKPGMYVRAQIEFARHEQATVVPVSALARRNGKQGVFLADTQDMKAQFVPVTLGIASEELAEVIEPPLDGLVVTLGHHLLEDGAAIRLPGGKPGEKQ